MPQIWLTVIAVMLAPAAAPVIRANEVCVRRAPNIRLPLNRRVEHCYDDPVFMLTPILPGTPGSSHRHYFLHTSKGIVAVDAAADRRVWAEAASCRSQPRLLWCGEQYALLATPYELFACAMEYGNRIWTVGGYPPDRDDPGADPEDFPPFRYFSVTDSHLVAIRDDQRAVCINPDSGDVLWKRSLEHKPAGSLVGCGDKLIFTARERGRSLCCVLDAGSGRKVAVFDCGVDAAVDRFLPIGNGAVVGITSGGLLAYDLVSGVRKWSAAVAVLPATVILSEGGIFVAARGGRVLRLDPSNGRISWETMLPIVGSETSSLSVRNDRAIVATGDRIIILDAKDGCITLAPDAPPDGRLTLAGVTDHYVLCVTFPDDRTKSATFHAYDLLVKDMGAATAAKAELGIIRDLRAVQLCNNALILQDGKRVVGITTDPGAR